MSARNPTTRPAPTYSGPQPVYDGTARGTDRADLRQDSRSLLRIGEVFNRISDVAQEKLTDNAVAHAQREGARLGGLNTKKVTVMRGGTPTEIDVPLLTRAEGTGAMARAWNQAAEASYAMRLDTVTMQHIQAAAAENPGDPEAIRQSLEGFKSGIIDAVPPDYLPKYERDLFAMAQPLITRAETEQMRQIAADQAIDAGIAADTLIGSMVVNSSLGEEGAIVSAAMFKNYVDAAVGRVGPFYSEAEARADIRAVLGRAASGALQATFEGAPDKRAMMAAFEGGQAVVSLPTVGADGEVTAGLYDKTSLMQLVGPEKVQALTNGLAVDIRMQESEARARAAEARAIAREAQAEKQRIVQLGFDDAEAEAAATGKSPMTATEIYDAYGDTPSGLRVADKMVAKLGLAAQTGSVRQVIAGNSMADDVAYVESLKPKGGDEDFADRQALYNIAVTEVEAKQKMLATDPATYVMQTSAAVQGAWEAARDNDPAKVQAAVAATRQAQIDLGVAPERVQAMPDAHAGALASTITSAAPDVVAETVDGIAAAYGDEGLAQVVAKGVPPMVKLVAFADNPAFGAYRQKAIQAMQVKETVLKEQVKARGIAVDDIETALATITDPLANTLPPAVFQPYLDGIRQVALFNVANGSMSAGDAAADAWSAFAASYSFNGDYRVPVRWDGDRVSSGLTGFIANLGAMDVRPAIQGATGDREFDKAQTVQAIQAGHYRWVTNSAETGVILAHENPAEGPILLGNGETIEVLFDAAVAMPGDPVRAYQDEQQRLRNQGQGAP